LSKADEKNEIYQVLTIKKPNYKSLMDICSVKVYNEKHFNWFQKIIWRLLLGIKITDVGGEDE